MKVLLLAMILVCTTGAFAQKTIVDVDKAEGVTPNLFYTVSGEPFVNVKFVRLTEGTPFFKDSWMKLLALTEKGQRFRGNKVKLNLLENDFHYLDENGTEMVAVYPFKELTLTDTISGANFRFFNSQFMPLLAREKQGWYLQLAEGKASLYQYLRKQMQEFKPYSSSVSEQKIFTMDEFYILNNGTLAVVKKPKDVPSTLPDKKAELETFLQKDDNKKATNAERIAALVAYYNTLK